MNIFVLRSKRPCRHVATIALATLALLFFATLPATRVAAVPPAAAEPIDLFAAVQAGDLEVKLIVDDIENAKIVARNNTRRPLTIRLPEAFAASPILAQNQGGGGGGGGVFNVPPEKVAKQDVAFVCLEHGKPDPRSTMQYEIKPIEAQTTNPLVIELLKQFSRGRYSHRAAQAAAWHLENNLSWRQLAAKERRHLGGGGDEPYFRPAELRQAVNIVADVNRIVAARPSTASQSLAD